MGNPKIGHIFFYGTIRPGKHNYRWIETAVKRGDLTHAGQATTILATFTMYVHCGVPYLVARQPAAAVHTSVTGDVYRIATKAGGATMRFIDDIEHRAGYALETVDVKLQSGKVMEGVGIYVATESAAKDIQQIQGLDIVRSGDFNLWAPKLATMC